MSSTYCPLPFKHAFIDSTGISPCCIILRQPVALENWKTNPNLLRIQQDLVSGTVPHHCRPCHDQEQVHGHSLRTESLRDYNNQVFSKLDIDFIDYRSSNICNFKCRSCGPNFSHKIAQEIKKNPNIKKFFRLTPLLEDTKTVEITQQNKQWVTDHVPQLKRIMFTGGEPTKIPEIKDIILHIQKNHKELQVLITSNGSFSDQFWYDITHSMPNLHWTISLDAVGPAAQIVRHGTNWTRVEHNARWLAQHASSLHINSVVSNTTVFQLRPLLMFVRDLQNISKAAGNGMDLGCRHQFFICSGYDHLSASNLSPDLRIKSLEYLKSCLLLDLDAEQLTMLTNLHRQIEDSKFNPALWNTSVEFHTALDQIRGEDHTVLFNPEQVT